MEQAATIDPDEAARRGEARRRAGDAVLPADTAFAFACNTRSIAVAASCDVDFLEPTTAGQTLVAVATERATRGRSGIYDVTVRRDGATVAELRGRSRTVGATATATATSTEETS